MGSATAERAEAARLPDGDVIAVLLKQHARIRDLFAVVRQTRGELCKQAFDELRMLLAVHEVAEELIVRPVAKDAAGEEEAEARNSEEADAAAILRLLETMDPESPEFTSGIEEFEKAVGDHADHEENEEFPAIMRRCTGEHRHTMGERLGEVEQAGRSGALAATGTFTAMLDKVRDAMTR